VSHSLWIRCNFFIQQRFFRKDELMATGLVKVRFLKRAGGIVSTKEVLDGLNATMETNLGELSGEWMAMEAKYFN
jgi:hypothetical protein